MATTTINFGDSRLPERFWRKVKRSNSGCWHWTGHVTMSGYGHYPATHDRPVRAHRYLYDQLVEPVYDRKHPDYREVDHECHNRSKSCQGGATCMHRRCVNPAHLASKTPRENSMASPRSTASRAVAAMQDRTHCPYGHPYSGENLYIAPSGGRRCRECARQADLVRHPRTGKRPGPATKTHCPEGHPYSGENLYIAPGSGLRHCRTCRRAKNAARYRAATRK
jgi:hypothetical protein